MSAEAPQPVLPEHSDPAALHAETLAAQEAYEAQLVQADEYAKKIGAPEEFPATPPTYEDTLRTKAYEETAAEMGAHGHDLLNGGDDLFTAAADAKAEAAVADYHAEVDREARATLIDQYNAHPEDHDRWSNVEGTLDSLFDAATESDDFTEFDTLFEKLNMRDKKAYGYHRDVELGGKETTPEPAPVAPDVPPTPEPAPGESEPTEPPAAEDEPEEPKEPEPTEPPEEPKGPKPGDAAARKERPRGDDDTRELPPVGKRPHTWEMREIARQNAIDRGEDVPDREARLAESYFDQIQDLPPDAIKMLHEIATINDTLGRGEEPSQKTIDAMDRLTDQLEKDYSGMADKLIDVYMDGGRFDHEGMKLTKLDAEFLDLLHQYKGTNRNNAIRKDLFNLWAKINSTERAVPVNWRAVEGGPITAEEGSYERQKGDWLLDRHMGTLIDKQFGTAAGGRDYSAIMAALAKGDLSKLGKNPGRIFTREMAEPIDALGRTKRRLGGLAMRAARAVDIRRMLRPEEIERKEGSTHVLIPDRKPSKK